jgi:nitrogen fixation protein NifB
MRHCRQCRADAVGMLGEDRGGEFTPERIAACDVDDAAASRRRAEVQADLARRVRGQATSAEGAGPTQASTSLRRVA